MAASLESLDQIRDTLISRGIGNSGLTSQAIQRANLPELSASLATARSIQANEANEREQKFKQAQLKSLSELQAATLRQQRSAAPIEDLSDIATIGLDDRGFSPRSGLAGVFRGLQTHGGASIGAFSEDILSALKRQNQNAVRIEEPVNLNAGLRSLRDQLVSLLRQQGVRIA